MAIVSDLPDDVVIEIWGYMYEPEDVESFALVPKGIYYLSTRFVRGHNHLKRQFSKMSVERYHPEGPEGASTAAELLNKIVLDPRSALYIRELQIWTLDDRLKGSFPENPIATSIHAIQNSALFASSIRIRSLDQFLGLVLMQLPKEHALGELPGGK